MPANKKHLTASPWQRFLKISAALLGGYMVSLTFHLLIMHLVDSKDTFMTMKFSVYIMWCFLMIIAFIAKSGWRIWAWYLGLSILFFAPFLSQ